MSRATATVGCLTWPICAATGDIANGAQNTTLEEGESGCRKSSTARKVLEGQKLVGCHRRKPCRRNRRLHSGQPVLMDCLRISVSVLRDGVCLQL